MATSKMRLWAAVKKSPGPPARQAAPKSYRRSLRANLSQRPAFAEIRQAMQRQQRSRRRMLPEFEARKRPPLTATPGW
jgi:hypothetical protein